MLNNQLYHMLLLEKSISACVTNIRSSEHGGLVPTVYASKKKYLDPVTSLK